ncbi:MAG: Spy/CpxP family protein refolding chaperone [Phormidesmis sp. CAN_BIN44]|nr:Spy/CpxP family protein refolding chaperone [Phormidesmis sp. CAN_BIN44]
MNDHPSRSLLKSPMIRRVAAIAALLMALGGAIALKSNHQADAKIEPSLGAIDPVAQSPTPLRRGMGWLRDLNLTSDQMQKIQAIRRQSKEQIHRQHQAIQQAQQELQSLMMSDAPVAQIREKYRQVKTLREQLADTQFDSLLETRQVLNADQRRKFADRMQRRRDPSDREPRS